MAERKSKRRSDCPVSFGLDIFGDKWTLLILRDMVFLHKRHYRELLASPERIATNILADRLKRLEYHGIIQRRVHPDSQREIIYSLTAKGAALIPVLVEIIRWGVQYDGQCAATAPADFLRRMERDREGLIAELQAAVTAPGRAAD